MIFCPVVWPGYNIAKAFFDKNDAVLLGITVDNIPTLFAWTQQMGKLWFPVLSDFWPHGAAAGKYGVLRSDGIAEGSAEKDSVTGISDEIFNAGHKTVAAVSASL